MEKARHQISFDLDTVTLRKVYPGKHYNNAYLDIRRVMEHNGFEHRLKERKRIYGYVSFKT